MYWAAIIPVLPNNHGPQTDRLVYNLGPFAGYDSGNATSREVGLYKQSFVDTFIQTLTGRRKDHRRAVRRSLPARREGHLRPGEPEPERSRRHPGRPTPAGRGRLHRVQRLLDRPRGAHHRHLPERHPAQRPASPELDRQPAPRPFEHQPSGRRRPSIPTTSSPACGVPAQSCRSGATVCRCSTPVSSERSARRRTCAAAR